LISTAATAGGECGNERKSGQMVSHANLLNEPRRLEVIVLSNMIHAPNYLSMTTLVAGLAGLDINKFKWQGEIVKKLLLFGLS
jgi:hypothetical protein